MARWPVALIFLASCAMALSAGAAPNDAPLSPILEIPTRTIVGACATFWPLKTLDEVDEKEHNFTLMFGAKADELRRAVEQDTSELNGLKAKLTREDLAEIDSLVETARQLEAKPGGVISALTGNAVVRDAAENVVITKATEQGRSINDKVLQLRNTIHQNMALLASIQAIGIAIKGCAADQRAYITKHSPEVPPTKPPAGDTGGGFELDRSAFAGSVAGLYSFSDCYGAMESWTRKQGFTLTIDPNFSVEGVVMIDGRPMRLYGHINHDGTFNTQGKFPEGDAPPNAFIAGTIERDSSGKLVIKKGDILAGTGTTGMCKGTIQ